MGSGKTTVGKHIAESLDMQFLDLDAYIEKKEEMPIATIFESRGEFYFRKKEYQYLEEVLSQKDDFVLSVGGGTPCYGKNLDSILKSTENVFYLNVPISQLVARLSKQKSQRPLIRDVSDEDLPEFIGKHLFERNAFYNQAHITLYCGDKSAEAIGVEILHILNPQ
ncbi:hypothetical protein LCGC14_1010320 [marine sediment metagenome]